ncbi:MAG TPA: endonuclease/exonuclease/phosphatase family protein [Tepidisphaeraceae bacterium]|jgi:hypothetical protein|nr:endonuclease/exonuclease/phosphatase family protein [Tepidisphaeraceae bacterium]
MIKGVRLTAGHLSMNIGVLPSPLTFLFWNIAGNHRADMLARLAHARDIDVLILAECRTPPGKLLTALSSAGGAFTHSFSQCEAIQVYTRFSGTFLTPVVESTRISIRRLRLPARIEILLAMMHLPSKRYRSETGQTLAATQYAELIGDAESIVGHTRTAVVGDLNMNPFEAGVSGAGGFHAVSSRQVAARQSRTVDGKTFRFFYNPMWGHFGDRAEGPPGTYYHAGSGPDAIFWHILDQVLVRPELLPAFRNSDLQILTGDGTESFINRNGIPDKAVASDHLPLLFRLYL